MGRHLFEFLVFLAILAPFHGYGQTQPPTPLQTVQIQVIDQLGKPVEGVTVFAGMTQDQPFINNLMLTNNFGVAEFEQASFSNMPITLVMAGYPRITYFNQYGTQFI
jgi:hypothetical protein